MLASFIVKNLHLFKNCLQVLPNLKAYIEEHCINDGVLIVPESTDIDNLEKFFISKKLKIFTCVSIYKHVLEKLNFKNIERVPYIRAIELLSKTNTQGTARVLYNTIIELKKNGFNTLDDIDFALETSSYLELIKTNFLNYSEFLNSNNFYDDGDYFTIFLESFNYPDCYNVFKEEEQIFFAGFTEYSSCDLELIKSFKFYKNVSVFSYDIFKINNSYTNFIKDYFIANDFKIIESSKEHNKKHSIYRFKTYKDELRSIEEKLKTFKSASVICLKDPELYYHNLKNSFDDISYLGAVRLDKSVIFNFILKVLELRESGFNFLIFNNFLAYPFLWEAYDELLKFSDFIKENNLHFDSINSLENLKIKFQLLNKSTKAVDELSLFLENVDKIEILNDCKNISASILNFTQNLKLDKKLDLNLLLELSSVKILLNQIAENVNVDENKNITISEYFLKLKLYSQSNYILKNIYNYPKFKITPARMFGTNTETNIVICGYEQKFLNVEEDIFFSDSVILKLRSANYLYPSSEELSLLNKNICESFLEFYDATSNLNLQIPDKFSSIIKEANLNISSNDPIYEESTENSFSIDYKNFNLSPSKIEAIIECPYKFFVSNILKVSASKYYTFLKYEELIEGTLVHLFLQKYLEDFIKNKNLLKLENINRFLVLLLDEKIEKLEAGLLPVKNNFINNISNYLFEFLGKELTYIESNNISIVGKELEIKVFIDENFEISKNGICLSGKIDRLDRVENEYIIVDYKKKKVPTKTEIFEAKKIQIPLYLKMFSNDFNLKAGEYLNVKEHIRRKVEVKDLEAIFIVFKNMYKDLILNTLNKKIDISPADTETCSDCLYRRICCVNRA